MNPQFFDIQNNIGYMLFKRCSTPDSLEKTKEMFKLFLSLLHPQHECEETTVDDLRNQINWRNIGCYPWNVEIGPNTTTSDELELCGQRGAGLVDLNKQFKTFVTQQVDDKLLVSSLAMLLQDWLRWLCMRPFREVFDDICSKNVRILLDKVLFNSSNPK